MSSKKPRSKKLGPSALSPAERAKVLGLIEAQVSAEAERRGKPLSVIKAKRVAQDLLPTVLRYAPDQDMAKAIDKAMADDLAPLLKDAIKHEVIADMGLRQKRDKRRLGSSAEPKSSYFRLNLTLPHDLDARLAEFGYKSRATGGSKLRKTEIMRALVRLLLELEIDLTGVRDEDEFLDRLRKAVGRK